MLSKILSFAILVNQCWFINQQQDLVVCWHIHVLVESKRKILLHLVNNQKSKINHYYKHSRLNDKTKVPKRVKDVITSACVECVVQDGRVFHLLKGSGFIRLAKELFNSGKLLSLSTNIQIEDLLPNPTTVSNLYYIQ